MQRIILHLHKFCPKDLIIYLSDLSFQETGLRKSCNCPSYQMETHGIRGKTLQETRRAAAKDVRNQGVQ